MTLTMNELFPSASFYLVFKYLTINVAVEK